MEKKDVAAVSAGLAAVSLSNETPANQEEDDDDSSLFAEPPPQPDCVICMLPLPIDPELVTYSTCCGKILCGGCSFMHQKSIYITNKKRLAKARKEHTEPPPLLEMTCPFCRVPVPDDSSPEEKNRENLTRLQKRANSGDAEALKNMALHYKDGSLGLPKDEGKFMEMALRASSLGIAEAHYELATVFLDEAKFTPTDLSMARVYLKKAAKGGHILSHHKLGAIERVMGHEKRAVRHWRIAAAAGHKPSADFLVECFQDGLITKESLEESMRARYDASKAFRSEERDQHFEYVKSHGEANDAKSYC